MTGGNPIIMNSPIENALQMLRTDARILNAEIELAEKYHDEIRDIYETITEELASLRAQKKALEANAKSITDQ